MFLTPVWFLATKNLYTKSPT